MEDPPSEFKDPGIGDTIYKISRMLRAFDGNLDEKLKYLVSHSNYEPFRTYKRYNWVFLLNMLQKYSSNDGVLAFIKAEHPLLE